MDDLLDRAYQAADQSYAPYSGKRNGATLETVSGNTYTGCTIENQNMINSHHAIEVALVDAIKNNERNFERVAVTAKPCGRCLQSLWEFCDETFSIVYVKEDGTTMEGTLGTLLPRPELQSGDSID